MNCFLIDDSAVDLKVGMIDQLDYHLLPSEAWEKLSKWYGVLDRQKALERKVISQGHYVKHLKVEVYLTDVKLSLFTEQDRVVVKKFSKTSKLGEHCDLIDLLLSLLPYNWTVTNISNFETMARSLEVYVYIEYSHALCVNGVQLTDLNTPILLLSWRKKAIGRQLVSVSRIF
jgi:hypothetical protein